MRWKTLLAMAVALVLIISWTATREGKSIPAYDKANEMIMMRNIGHQLLLHVGDSTSRVLPVQQTGEHEYVLRFASPFTFVPDSLVKAIDRVVKKHRLPPTYLVEVITCLNDDVVFGYSIFKDSTNNIVPCRGRAQVMGCYKIKLQFPATAEAAVPDYFLPGSLAAICLSLLVRFLYKKRNNTHSGGASIAFATAPAPATATTDPDPEPTLEVPANFIPLGRYRFYTGRQQLQFDQETIPLTAKESKLLQVFAASPNVVIDRDRLLKEVWEDEGVITGRSLDMFVSKLRKRLQLDAGISIINVHGKGYKLAIDDSK
ncbi:winged helix family transcriptional regulator [Paraflavitalea soli]|uniref:Winged helix family transcriptional regulator n=1 Tax=Paraflavitalea soli TaxID=2315862 RepID=A0A3B7MKM8_9BACT|nr:winged helix-turn-helix domain-containing protein [Paraflavitalea soli]AXY74207.1 winged helix family transcriptional regulator [Paraflavitalea soli]